MKLPTLGSIHTVRGHIVHSVLEDFFDLPLGGMSKENFKNLFHQHTERLLVHHWRGADKEIKDLKLATEELMHYFDETTMMLSNWVNKISEKIVKHPSAELSTSFKTLIPIREKHYMNHKFMVQGYMDAIEEIDGKVRVMDYKTSSRAHLTDEYRLQLAIYALLYHDEHGKMPNEVGIYFLKDAQNFEQVIPVNDEMIEKAKSEVEVIHLNTGSIQINDYPKREGPLCKWRTGQCDFYEVCFGQKSLEEFAPNVKLPNGTSVNSK